MNTNNLFYSFIHPVTHSLIHSKRHLSLCCISLLNCSPKHVLYVESSWLSIWRKHYTWLGTYRKHHNVFTKVSFSTPCSAKHVLDICCVKHNMLFHCCYVPSLVGIMSQQNYVGMIFYGVDHLSQSCSNLHHCLWHLPMLYSQYTPSGASFLGPILANFIPSHLSLIQDLSRISHSL